MTRTPFTVGVALDGVGWHPAATAPTPRAQLSLGYWSALTAALGDAGIGYVTFEDTFSGWAPSWHTEPADAVGRLDAHTLAAFLAGRTSRLGLIPTETVTHTEPYHVATRLQTLDFAAAGRAGWQVRVSGDAAEAALTALGNGRGPALVDGVPNEAIVADLFDEAVAVVDTARALWDSWEDDAEIRDTATGRFLDGDKLHHVEISTPWFSVAGPSIVPRSPSGQVLVTALAHATVPYRFAAQVADVVFVTPGPGNPISQIVTEVREQEQQVGRTSEPLRVVADLVVAVGEHAEQRFAALEATAPLISDADVVVGTPSDVADRIAELRDGGAEGVRLRPVENDPDVRVIAGELVPELLARGLASPHEDADGLRAVFGLSRPANRFGAAPTTLAGAR